MKTNIIITGQISGNHTLVNAISTYESEKHNIGFNNYRLSFPTKAAAKKALWEAFKYLRADKQDAYALMLSYSKHGSMRYDASRAEIRSND